MLISKYFINVDNNNIAFKTIFGSFKIFIQTNDGQQQTDLFDRHRVITKFYTPMHAKGKTATDENDPGNQLFVYMYYALAALCIRGYISCNLEGYIWRLSILPLVCKIVQCITQFGDLSIFLVS